MRVILEPEELTQLKELFSQVDLETIDHIEISETHFKVVYRNEAIVRVQKMPKKRQNSSD